MTAKHHNPGLKRDAASIWIEDVTLSSCKVCLRELQNYAGSHKDIYVVSIAFIAFVSYILTTNEKPLVTLYNYWLRFYVVCEQCLCACVLDHIIVIGVISCSCALDVLLINKKPVGSDGSSSLSQVLSLFFSCGSFYFSTQYSNS